MTAKLVSFLICLLLTLSPVAITTDLSAQPRSTLARPNIILINVDDADTHLLSPQNMSVYFPNLERFSKEGLRLGNFHVTTPLCGPSRAALFVAKYAHRNGIRTNNPFVNRSNGFAGGMVTYGERGHHENDISTWMKAAGYRTMMIGKYLHGDTVDIVPKGWDDFYSSRGANYYGTARLTNDKSPIGKSFIEPVTTYRTTREGEEALMLIERHAERDNDQPFFLYLAPLAPHQQTPHSERGMIEKKYEELWQDALMPLSIDYQEADFSDKSTAIRDLPPMTERQVSRLNPRYRERLVSLKSVDDLFAALTDKLQQLGLAENTYIILTSDNGFSNGHHRMIGKGDAFNRSTHVPTYVLGPGVAAGVEANHLLAHIDLAPTIVDLAGGNVPDDLDGKSFASLLANPQSVDERAWRDAILIENWESRFLHTREYNTACMALRFFDSAYVEWANGTPEFYDLKTDPHQVENAYESLPDDQKQKLVQQLKSYRREPMLPQTTLSHPFQMNQIHSRRKPIQGMAENDTGITAVRLTIRRLSDHHYWNGDHWQLHPVNLDADVTNPGQAMTTWRYESIPGGQPTDDLLVVTASAGDESGQWDPDPAWVVFRLDYTRPSARILKPEMVKDPLDEFRIAGTASDEASVDHVLLAIRNYDTSEYWSGKGWSTEWTSIKVPVRRSGRWNYFRPDFEGTFDVSVRAVDSSGNVQSPPLKTRFTVTSTR